MSEHWITDTFYYNDALFLYLSYNIKQPMKTDDIVVCYIAEMLREYY